MRIKGWAGLFAAALCFVTVSGLARAADRAGARPKPAPKITFSGKVTAVDAAASSVTLTNRENLANTYTVPAGVEIKVNGNAGTMADIKVGMQGRVRLADDNKTVTGVQLDSPETTGKVAAVDAAAGNLTFTGKDKVTATYTVPAGIPFRVNGKAGSLADVKVGMTGAVKIAADGKSLLGLRLDTPELPGKVTAVDAVAGNLTLTNRDKVATTYTVPAGIPIKVNGKDGTLADVKVGMIGGVKTGQDEKTLIGLRLETEKPHAEGKVASVEAGGLTLTDRQNQAHAILVPMTATINVNGKPGTLADVKLGMTGRAVLTDDGKTAVSVQLQTPEADFPKMSGKVTAVDAAAGSITLTDKQGANTYTVPAGAKITLDGKAATMADVRIGMRGHIRLLQDGKTPTDLRLESPRGR